MKFRFCGGLEPPDWLLAEVPILSGNQSKLSPRDLAAMCEAIGADIAVQELEQTQELFDEATDAKAALAALRFILMHAAKYDTERVDLVEELQQLGMQLDSAEAIAQSYEDQRAHIQAQQRAQRFQFPSIDKLEWKVETSSKVNLNLKLDRAVVECNVATTATTAANSDLNFDMGKNKFLALYEELSQAQAMLHGV